MSARVLAPVPRPDLDHILAHTESLWREMAGASIFITGGTGFFGLWLLESLAWANERLKVGVGATVLSRDLSTFSRRLPHLAANESIELLAGDVRNFHFPAGRFTHVIHAAFDSGRAIANPLAAFDTLATGTRRVIEFVATQPLQRMLFISSGAVYGPQPKDMERLAESHPGGPDPLTPASAYAEGKRVGEFLCGLAAANGLPVSIARCFAFLGPGLPTDGHFAAGNFLRDACLGNDLVVTGDGSPVRSYLHAADLAIWLWSILLRGKPGRAYNVGGDRTISIGDLAQLIAAQSPGRPRVRIIGTGDGDLPERYVPDIARAASELGLRPCISLEQGIQRTLGWLPGCRP
ncbi:MAG: NAD-dependent epimerase/dehydratase family protein [Sulfuritalea sp.]|nr:NAD-dependent epimerase/dehydratase family protein [Sulfuritalea sp.]